MNTDDAASQCTYSSELVTLWEHFDLMFDSIKDPDVPAEAACRANLISTDSKDILLQHGYFNDTQAKTHSLLQIVEHKVSGDFNSFHQFLVVLHSVPELTQLASYLQASYDNRVIGTLVMNSQQTGGYEEDESNMRVAEYSNNSEGEESSDMYEDYQQDSEQECESQGGDAHDLYLDQIDNTVLCPEDEQAVRKELMSLAAKYDSIGITLGLLSSESEIIGHEYVRDAKRALGQVIRTWLKQSYNVARFGLPSWRSLVEAVDSTAGGSHHALAKKIASKHKANRKRQLSAHESEPQPKLSCIEDGPLVKFKPKLADFYSKKPEVPESTWPPVKKTHFVNLALIKHQAINYAKGYVRQTVQNSIDDIIKDKDKIDYEDAFAELEDGALVVMEGRPGCGKTTLMHKLSRDWGKRRILSSHLFFLIHFRRFNNRSDIKLQDILRAATLDLTGEEIEEICTYIREDSGRGVVFALDGLDEYCPESKNNLFFDLIKRERFLTNAIVIIASRPAASHKFRRYAAKHIEVLGFLKPQIQEYVENYFKTCPDKARGLIRYLEHHLNVMHMCYLPLHLAMVTYLYEEEANLPETETNIYKHFTLSTLIRSFERRGDDLNVPFVIDDFDDLSHNDKRVVNLISILAFNATVNSKQLFTLKEVKECISEQFSSSNYDSSENSLGLIVIDRIFVKRGVDETYTFIHLTFQEFLAAYFVASQDELEQTNLLKTHGSKESLAEVWKFYCGLGKCSSENFKLLLNETKQSESNRSRRKKDTCISSILLQLHCAYESQQEEKCRQIMETYDSSIALDNESLNPVNMTALGYVVVKSKASLKELAITSCHLGPEGLTAFATEVGDDTLGIETLSFRGTAILQNMSDEFASLFKLCPSIKSLNVSRCSILVKTLSDISNKIPELKFLTKLDISLNQLGRTGTAVESLLSKTSHLETIVVHLYKDCQWFVSLNEKGQLKDINVKMIIPQSSYGEIEQDLATCTELNLNSLKLGDREAEIIGEQLKECTSLTKLSLGYNQIGDAGAQAIAEGLKLCPNLQTIGLGYNKIGDAGAQAITEGLKLCPDLQKIDLGGNEIEAAGAQAIAEGLKLCPNLQTIDLRNNQIGDAGAQAIADGCKLCPNLQAIDLGDNQIEAAGAQAITEGLKLCPNLQTIKLWGNSITDASVPHLVRLMETARKLKEFHLYVNKFTDAGESQLKQAAEKRNNDQANYVHLDLVV